MIGLDTRRILRISAHVHSFTLKMHVQAICNHMFIFYKTLKISTHPTYLVPSMYTLKDVKSCSPVILPQGRLAAYTYSHNSVEIASKSHAAEVNVATANKH